MDRTLKMCFIEPIFLGLNLTAMGFQPAGSHYRRTAPAAQNLFGLHLFSAALSSSVASGFRGLNRGERGALLESSFNALARKDPDRALELLGSVETSEQLEINVRAIADETRKIRAMLGELN
jgi:hypothetical protein